MLRKLTPTYSKPGNLLQKNPKMKIIKIKKLKCADFVSACRLIETVILQFSHISPSSFSNIKSILTPYLCTYKCLYIKNKNKLKKEKKEK